MNTSKHTSRTIVYRNEKCCLGAQESSSLCVNVKKQRWEDFKGYTRTGNNHRTSESVDHNEQSKMSPMMKKVCAVELHCKGNYVCGKCPYRTECYQCKDLVQKIRNLLEEIRVIRTNLPVVNACGICKRFNISGNCRRCVYLRDKFKTSGTIDNYDRQQRFKIWLCKIKQILYTILERETCKHKVYKKTDATDELTHLLHQLKSRLEIREPDISYFPTIDSLENITESKDILDQVLLKLQADQCSGNSVGNEDNFLRLQEISLKGTAPPPTPESKEVIENSGISNAKSMEVGKTKKKQKNVKRSPKQQSIIPERSAEGSPRQQKNSKSPTKKDPARKSKLSLENKFMMEMIKAGSPTKPKIKDKVEKLPVMPIIEDLPIPKIKELRKTVSDSESVIECGITDDTINEMIKGTEIITIGTHKHLDMDFVQPPLCRASSNYSKPLVDVLNTTRSNKTKKSKPIMEQEDAQTGKGIIKYMLSNREFIDKGWTLLPTTKIMRRMNIYNMRPANRSPDWFERHKNQKLMYHESGEKLAEIIDDDRRKIFYKNGNLALHYYCDKESLGSYRYVVYSSGDNTDAGKSLPVTVLACFDYQGNGVVYDHYGNERLKYNQSEGIVKDCKIGPPGRWRWHALNEPPVLKSAYTENIRPSLLEKRAPKDDKFNSDSNYKKEENIDMLTIELNNCLREKTQALMQEFKPFKIKFKALKINYQFSLKMLDQSNIFLVFREGHTKIKLNLGLHLISNEIVDTSIAEVTEVAATPYDSHPPKSQSIADIQIAVGKAKKLGKSRGKMRK